MNNFSNFITEEKNTHMTHIEDKVIYGGVNGTRQAIMALRMLRDMLGGTHEGSVSVKWDGAPAVFCGTDPTDGKFFVAKKGIFNKNPKVYKTAAEVEADTSGDLAAKLKAALKYLPELGIKGVIQGDFLFSSEDVSNEIINGQRYLTFHPNTIIYAVPHDSEAAANIRKAKIGIVWHTTYNGNSFESMSASYGVDISKFHKSANVWSQDAMLRDLTNATMSKQDTEIVNELLTQAGKLFNQISGSTLRELEANGELAQHIETFNNSFVRVGTIVTDTRAHVNHLIKWIHDKYQKEIDARKTPVGKANVSKKRQDFLDFFSETNKASLIKMFDLQKVIVLAKLKLINTLNKLQTIDTFVKSRNGFKVTGAEGYVAIDKLSGDAIKIVDRMEFSFNNFSPDILKGWDKLGKR
jgi:hypothetical protein